MRGQVLSGRIGWPARQTPSGPALARAVRQGL